LDWRTDRPAAGEKDHALLSKICFCGFGSKEGWQLFNAIHAGGELLEVFKLGKTVVIHSGSFAENESILVVRPQEPRTLAIDTNQKRQMDIDLLAG
jgi:hypothetical protein